MTVDRMHETRPRRRTTMNLDVELVRQARDVLGTRTATETVHEALEAVVRRKQLRSLSEWDLGGLTLEELRELRAPRTFE